MWENVRTIYLLKFQCNSRSVNIANETSGYQISEVGFDISDIIKTITEKEPEESMARQQKEDYTMPPIDRKWREKIING